jgi:hypothetical protein
MVCAVATLGTNHAKPFGPELQVKQMLNVALTTGQNIKYKGQILCQEQRNQNSVNWLLYTNSVSIPIPINVFQVAPFADIRLDSGSFLYSFMLIQRIR